jgi:lipopolysaccharide biosynthesis protein
VFDDIARQLEDARALRIGGKPVVMVYRPSIIPAPRLMTEIWRERAHKRGWPGLYLIAANAFGYDAHAEDGFDALAEFPPHGIAADRIEASLAWLNPRHGGAVYDYSKLAERQARRLDGARRGGATVFPGVMPGWDNEARRPGAGAIYDGAAPQAYAQWLAAAVRYAARELPGDRRIVFLNAWNEWAEGAYLEPDRRFGRAYLAATAQVLRAAAADAPA